MGTRIISCFYNVFQNIFGLYHNVAITYKSKKTGCNELLFMFSLFPTVKEYNPFTYNTNKKVNRYWNRESVTEVLEDADNLFTAENYLEIYEILNRLKYEDNVEVQWRICRSLFKMSSDQTLPSKIRNEMILEAYDLMMNTMRLDHNNANVHKWIAIITDAKSGLEGTVARVKSYEIVKTHLTKAAELNPGDISVLYMLGKWCFDMSHFTWYQRKISSMFFADPPTSCYEEAYNYFLRAEEIKPRFYLPNIYMLGRTSFHMKQYFRAKYYLNIAARLPPRTEFEKQCAGEAKALANDLNQFDISRDALFQSEDNTNSNF